MKVHYKPTILDELDTAIEKAAELNKKIDYIELNEFEWFRLVYETPTFTTISAPVCGQTSYRGIVIKRKKDEVSTKFHENPWATRFPGAFIF